MLPNIDNANSKTSCRTANKEDNPIKIVYWMDLDLEVILTMIMHFCIKRSKSEPKVKYALKLWYKYYIWYLLVINCEERNEFNANES